MLRSIGDQTAEDVPAAATELAQFSLELNDDAEMYEAAGDGRLSAAVSQLSEKLRTMNLALADALESPYPETDSQFVQKFGGFQTALVGPMMM